MRCLLQLGWAIALLVLAGCPSTPTLLVQPLAVAFSSTDDVKEIRILNAGSGSLSWQASVNLPWLSLSLPTHTELKNTVIGETTTEIDVIQLTVDRSALPLGVSTGEVVITSNGGDQTVAVSAAAEGSALMDVSPLVADFGLTTTAITVQLSNAGTKALDWEITIPDDAPWLTAAPVSGSIAVGGNPQTVTLSASRDGLASGTFAGTVSVSSNGGDASIAASMQVPPFSVLPTQIDFGAIAQAASQIVTVTNGGFSNTALSCSAVTDDGAPWLSVTPATGTLPGSGTLEATVTASPAGLAPASYTGHVTVTATVTGYSWDIPVSMVVTEFSISPASIDFGTITASAMQQITLQNLGTLPLEWNLVKPNDAVWINLSKTAGTLSASDTIDVTAYPATVDPGDYSAVLTFTVGNTTQTVNVQMSRPRPAALSVAPVNLDFGASRTEDLIGIWNDGTGSISWSIDTTGFPAWLSLSPVDAGGIASGTVSGAATDALTISVDRSKAPAGQFNFEYAFTVAASGDSTTPVTVTVQMNIAKVPAMVIESDGVTETGIPYINLGISEEEKTFYIRNDGTGALSWSFDLTSAPAWLTAITPSQGSLDPGIQQTVTVSVSREDLNYLGAQNTFTITSNDPDHASQPFLVEVQVAKSVIIGVSPVSLSFGTSDSSTLVGVANLGDPDTVLTYKITPTKEWLAAYPDTGSSIGVTGDVKDWQTVSVSIDRTRLDGESASAKLVVSAYEIVDGEEVPSETVDPVEIAVSAEARALTIETAVPRVRVPSLVRTVLLMRNVRCEALPIPDSYLDTVGNKFAVYEKDTALELTETNQFLTSGSRIHGSALILLDYSGSMQAAAHELTDASIVAATDRLQAVYQQSIPPLIAEMPDTYRVALAVFNERGDDAIRIIWGADTEPAFTYNKTVLLNRLNNIEVVDNGATQLLPALNSAAAELLDVDVNENLIPFDNADVRALICVTDGRITTPPGNVSDTISALESSFVRLFCIGWGDNVLSDPLIRITEGTGGHYYSTRGVATGATDAFGTAIRIPVLTDLQNWCATDTTDTCDQSIAKDLLSQTVFSYTTLSEEGNVNLDGKITFNDPNDQDSPCLSEQGDITGSFSISQLDFSAIAGDPRLGQISLRSSGIQADGTATVTVHADYIPRNISQFSFRLETVSADALITTVRQPATTEGGIISDWTASGAAPVYTFTSPGDPLKYGDFGDLLIFTFQGATSNFRADFTVLEPIYSADPNIKYFTCPDSITVTANTFLASSFPSPYLVITPAPISTSPIILDLGTAVDSAQVLVYNRGGHHTATGVWLDWLATPGSTSSFLTVSPNTGGTSIDTLTPSVLTINVDRSIAAGDYEGSVGMDYIYGSLGLEFTGNPIYVYYRVLGPELTLSTTTLDFDAVTNDLLLTISNTGQGTLDWGINAAALPSWLSISSNTGTLGPGATETLDVSIVRAALPASGLYSTSFALDATPYGAPVVNVSVLEP